MRSRRSRGMHHLFINLHVKYKYNNYLHTHTHAHAARSHTRKSWHLPFTKHRRFLQQKKDQKRANCGLRCHSQRSCACQKHENRFLLTLFAPLITPKSSRAPGFCTYSYYNKNHPRKGPRPFSSNMHPHNRRPYQNEEAPKRLLEGHSARRLAVDRICSLRDRLS